MLFNLLPFLTQITNPESIAIFIGTGIQSELKKRAWIDAFWTKEGFEATKTDKNMEKLHGKDWTLTIRSVLHWLKADSSLWLAHEVQAAMLNNRNSRIFFVCGTDSTEAFDLGMFLCKLSNPNHLQCRDKKVYLFTIVQMT